MRIIITIILIIQLLPLSGHCSSNEETLNYDSLIRTYSKKSIEDITSLGYRNLEKGNYDEALTLYTVAAALPCDTTQPSRLREYIKALNNIGYIYLFDRHNPEKAYPYLLQARDMAEQGGYPDILAAILDNIAKVHDDFGDSEKAIDIYNQAMVESAKMKTEISPVIQLMVFNDLINCAVAHDMTDKLRPGLEIFSSLPEYQLPMGHYSRKMCEGLKALTQKDTVEALSIIRDAITLVDSKVDYARNVTNHLLTVATLYHMLSRQDSARIYLDRALATARENNLADRLPRIYRAMATIESSIGHQAEYARMMLMSYQADDSLHSSKTYAFLQGLESTNRIEGLNLQLKEASIRQRHRSTIIWILTVAVVLIATLLGNIIVRNRRLASSLKKLVARHQASVAAEEANSRLMKEYEMTITSLRNELENQTTHEPASTPCNQKGLMLPVDESERLRIIGEVNEIFSSSSEVFEPEFSMERLADMTSTKPRYLSALLNDTMGKSFSQLLSDARIKKACEMLLSPDFKKTLTIEAIAQKVGYKSRTHFTSVFKKITGVTPLQYVAMA